MGHIIQHLCLSSCSGVHYYWNTTDDSVSWLPPSHPKAHISKSAAVLRKELEALQPEDDIEPSFPDFEPGEMELPLPNPVSKK